MAGRRGEHTIRPPGPTERITVTLIPTAGSQLQQHRNSFNADLTIAPHEFLAARVYVGYDLITHDHTGATRMAQSL
jgi:hypothetical protein